MNKILMDEEFRISNSGSYIITCSGRVTINICEVKEDIDLNIILNDDAILDVNDFNLHAKTTKIIVNQNNNSKFTYNHTFKISDEYNFFYKAVINGDNNVNNINISGVSNGMVKMDVDGVVKEHSKNNELNENIKILTIDGKAFISPMLHVNALDVIANHNTAISNVREDEIFYLMSKGISREKSIGLIEDGYLYGLFKNNKEFLSLINKISGGEFIE